MKNWLAIAVIVGAHAARADSLDAIFARMDEAAKKFKGVTAKIHRTDYTAVIQESTQEEGDLFLKRLKGGMAWCVVFNGPDARTVAFEGHTLTIYYPKPNQAQIIDVSKYTSTNTVDQLLLLSFGAASGTELKKNYAVSIGGTEDLGGVKTTRMELAPKSDEMKKVITRIQLWIPEGQTIAAKERADEPSKNYVVWTYSEVKMSPPNPAPPDSTVLFKLPPKAKIIGAK